MLTCLRRLPDNLNKNAKLLIKIVIRFAYIYRLVYLYIFNFCAIFQMGAITYALRKIGIIRKRCLKVAPETPHPNHPNSTPGPAACGSKVACKQHTKEGVSDLQPLGDYTNVDTKVTFTEVQSFSSLTSGNSTTVSSDNQDDESGVAVPAIFPELVWY